MKKLLLISFTIFLVSIFVSCLSTSESTAANETKVVDSTLQDSQEEVLDPIADILENTEIDTLETLEETPKLEKETYHDGEIPVHSNDLSLEEAQRLFGKGEKLDSPSKEIKNNATQKQDISQNNHNGQVFSPKDTHVKSSGKDSMSVKGSLGSGATKKEATKTSEPVEEEREATKTSEPVEEKIEVTKTSEPVEEEIEATKTSEPVEEEIEVTKTSEPVEEEREVTKTSEPVKEEIEATKTSEPVEEEREVTKTSELVEEEIKATKTSEPVEEEIKATKTSEPVKEEKEATKTSEPVEEEREVTKTSELVEEETEIEEIDQVANVPPQVPISRTVTMDNRQFLDIVYPGSGWIYMGEVPSNTELLTYFGRKLNDSDTVFTLRSVSPGTTILHFYKQDILSASYIDDYIEVTITDVVSKSGARVLAPSYSEIVPAYQYEIPDPAEFVVEEEIEVEQEVLSEEEKLLSDSSTFADNSPKNQQVETSSSEKSIQNEDTSITETKPTQENSVLQPSNQDNLFAEAPIISYVEDTDPSETVIQDATQNQDIFYDTDNSVPSESDDLFESLISISPSNNQVSQGEVLEGDALGTALSLLEQAKLAYNHNEYKKAADLLEQFFLVADSKIDEALYLKGQVYEAKSEIQNIRTALSAYKQLVNQFPQSSYWQLAKNKETYLNRFYFDIR
ncbi:MAG: hypothetical protein J6B32_00780 [Spirochaetaceae bacterium]|nr:hypothetical protein [Spirochaetaceae bacterium]